MEKKNNKSKTLLLLSLLLMAVIAVTIVVGLVSAKYVTEKHIPGKITIRADLADDIEVFEHTITGNPDVYELTTAETKEGNEYLLMPGVDVPKDPHVRILGYNGVNAYVYVEVKSTADPTYVKFSLDEKWVRLTDITDRNIYYYTGELAADEDGNVVLPILDGKGLIVSYGLPRATTATITFDAFIAQRTAATPSKDDATSVFNSTTFDPPASTDGPNNG